ncbi:complement component C1q receptor [Microcaecilia unicolor]|uniref:Complement component C1q receptor n=1 Tax=Microcaecilia unicolor TaxID=1415580 RepID=A0A6P7XG30_9AMPH|nr:complement component C1q receptor [Microcaecilia unicolor]
MVIFLWQLVYQVLLSLRVPTAAAKMEEAKCSQRACYTLHLDFRNFLEAQEECRGNGGNLATAKSPEEALELQTLLLNFFTPKPGQGAFKFWIGLELKKMRCYQKDKVLRGFSWVSSREQEEESHFSDWMQEPQMTCTTHRCVAMNYLMSSSKNFKWSDGKCSTPVNGYFCKFSFQGMCHKVVLAGPGIVTYTTPFGLQSTSLNLVPFGSMATVSCETPGELGGHFLMCNTKEDGKFDWNHPGSGPYCASPKHGCSYNNGGCEQACTEDHSTKTFHCDCKEGYELRSDLVSCAPQDHCKSNPCSHGCASHQKGFECKCPLGYMLGENRLVCKDVDECLDRPCEQLCTNSPGSFSCSCFQGFQAVGRECRDIDECDRKPCAQSCLNTPGSFICSCREGYEKGSDAASCVDVDECEAKPCADLCRNTEGSYKCFCEQGFLLASNGISCVAIQSFQTVASQEEVNVTLEPSERSPLEAQAGTKVLIGDHSDPESTRPQPLDSVRPASQSDSPASVGGGIQGVLSTLLPDVGSRSHGTGSVDHMKAGADAKKKQLLFYSVGGVAAVLLVLALALGLLMCKRKRAKKEPNRQRSAADNYCWVPDGEKAADNEYR